MRKNNNKQHLQSNYDYLNFIRRNQQIVKEFKQLSQIDKKAHDLRKVFSNTGNPQKITIETDRYSEAPPFFQDSLFNYRQKVKYEITSLNDLYPNVLKSENMQQIKARKQTDLTQRSSQAEIYSRNLSIPTKGQRNNINEAVSQVKFPKLAARASHFEQQRQPRSNSQTSLSLQKKNTYTQKSKKKQKGQRLNKDNWKKNYAPLSVESCKLGSQNGVHCSINSLKFNEKQKGRINEKLVKTYYDYENLLQLKQRVAQLMPTFKPIQSKKRDRIHILQLQKQHQYNQLEKYLQANMIHRTKRTISRNARKKGETDKQNQEQLAEESKDEQNNEQNNYQSSNPENTPRLNANEDQEQCGLKELTIEKAEKIEKGLSPTKAKAKKQIKIPQAGNLNAQQQTVYQNKIQSYRQFLFFVNFCHRVFDPLIIKEDPDKHKVQNKYKYYIGPGNNSLLIKSLMKRRFWWVQVDDPKQANFVWTQLKINNYFQFQKKTQLTQVYDKLDEDHPYTVSKQKKIAKSKTSLQTTKKADQPKVGGILRGQLPENQKKIFTNADCFHWAKMLEKVVEQNPQMKNFSKFQTRLKYLPQQFLKKREENINENHMHNHLVYNYQIGNKKALFYNLKHYYEMIGVNPFNSIPLTFHIKKGVQDPQYAKFMKEYKKLKAQLEKAEKDNSSKKKLSRNVWIVKPGQLSNRGNGITVIDQIYELNTILKSKEKHKDGAQKTYIVQKYIEKPMLYKNRKFDIRHYMMISRLHGRMRAYWFSEGYIRTSSYEYDLEEVGDVMIHLTNDAIQKHGVSYGKYQEGNKLSYAEFQRYLDSSYPQKKYSFIDSIYPRMRQIASDAVKSTYLWMDPDKLEHNFEVFGLDFMIDANFNVWLIQVNTNPCLQLSSGLLGRIIPTMVQNSLRLCLDPIFPPTAHYLNTIKYLAPDSPMERLQFQLIFDESRDGKKIQQLFKKNGKANCGQIEQEDETYENDGKQIDLGGDLQ